MWLSEKAKASLGEVRDLPDMKPIIEKIVDDLQIHYDNGVMRAVQDCGIHVDKERLLKALTDARAFYDEGYAAGQTVQQKWIPVTERLPEDGAAVLVFCVLAWRDYCRQDVVNYHSCLEEFDEIDFEGQKHGGFVFYDSEYGYCEKSNVTHWMPLPQPPKEVEG